MEQNDFLCFKRDLFLGIYNTAYLYYQLRLLKQFIETKTNIKSRTVERIKKAPLK